MLELEIECMESNYFIPGDESHTITLTVFVKKVSFFIKKTLCDKTRRDGRQHVKAMLHEAIFLATCNATMTNDEKTFQVERGCYTQATCLATLRKVEGRSAFLATRNATSAVAKWGVYT